MKIHITGSAWQGGLSMHLGNGFKSLGHDVEFFDENGPRKLVILKRALIRVVRKPYGVEDWFRNKLGKRWLESVLTYSPDLIIIEHAPNILPEYIEQARALGKPIIYWVTAPPDNIQYKEFLLALKYVDKVFAIDRQWIQIMEKFSYGKPIEILALGGADDAFKPLIADHEAREKQCLYDFVFIGSFTPQDFSASWRASLLDSVPPTFNMAIFGGSGLPYWKKRFPNLLTFSKNSNTSLSTERMNEIYNQSKIAITVQSTNHLSGVSARVLEVGLAGTFQIVDFREDLEVLFPKNTFATFRSREALLPLMSEWLNKPKERWDNADRVRSLVLANHTWKHRAAEMLKAIGVA